MAMNSPGIPHRTQPVRTNLDRVLRHGPPLCRLVGAFCLAGGLLLATAASAQEGGLGATARGQIETLMREKAARTPAQRKLSSQLVYEIKRRRGDPLLQALPDLRRSVELDRAGQVLVDINAEVSEGLLRRIEALGGSVVNSFPRYRAIRARLPLMQLETLAESPRVQSIRPADKATTNKVNTSEGDVAHQADKARAAFAAEGSGTFLCVLSDSIDALATLQGSGDLPAGVFVLPGQSGNPGSSEGTAMLEIIFDLAPKANLGFATAFGSPAQFATNIQGLRAAGCDVIVDDVFYFSEPVFQDGIVAQAVNTVVADGAVYFSSAGNSGNLNDGTSGVWEGNYLPMPPPPWAPPGQAESAHDFGGGNPCNTVTVDSPSFFTLKWSDPQGGSANDYDFYLLDPGCEAVLAASTDIQAGTQDPFEDITSIGFDDTNTNLVIIRKTPGQARFLHLNTNRGELAIATDGQTGGHSAARGAIGVAAVDWFKGALTPVPFNGTESVETFSSDGPRRIFYRPNGAPITPGDFSSSGGLLLQKPDITAADGVSTATPGPGFNPFFGTSAAAPHAAAIAGLMLSLDPTLCPGEARVALTRSALDIEAPGVDRDSGAGIADAVGALGEVGSIRPIAADFHCDRRSDLLWRNTGTGGTIGWQMDGFAKESTQSVGAAATAWQIAGLGDFDDNGKADILWRNTTTGATVIWQMNGFTKVASASIGAPATAWQIRGVGDFDGDGTDDILWRNTGTNVTVIWRMLGLAKVASGAIGAPASAWQIRDVGDFDGDGTDDILWRNTATGGTVIWRMLGLAKAGSASIGAPATTWQIEGAGDFDGDGTDDILWRNTGSGGTVIWRMVALGKNFSASIGAVPLQWQAACLGDYDGGGRFDILWRNTLSGGNIVWLMDGFSRQAAAPIGGVPISWQLHC